MYTLIAFPSFITGMTGISYARIGVRRIWVHLSDHSVICFKRSQFPDLKQGNDLAFQLAAAFSEGIC